MIRTIILNDGTEYIIKEPEITYNLYSSLRYLYSNINNNIEDILNSLDCTGVYNNVQARSTSSFYYKEKVFILFRLLDKLNNYIKYNECLNRFIDIHSANVYFENNFVVTEILTNKPNNKSKSKGKIKNKYTYTTTKDLFDNTKIIHVVNNNITGKLHTFETEELAKDFINNEKIINNNKKDIVKNINKKNNKKNIKVIFNFNVVKNEKTI